eukprot:CAMPEP_0172921174 /NCGR_PEP_ID=MMETSP1075-20121228/205392_1 /TAXON_ID=2916 /ORGANISM="Ceratium fusus, Strain PA161109" /LENGTH=264 /DNA_ID=CAMNT_0013781299 /DNA_START=299 /DNA_END=1093 /DNA_ORIENTATION=-
MTESVWENHIFLFGGLVRDILRRTVGNDIDIAFSAPAVELQAICEKAGYKCQVDGDYILVGDQHGVECLEGMVITHNGIQPSYHADFAMNWVFYDFCNDVIVDKAGSAVADILANRCSIPCARSQWPSWLEVNGCRVLFRYYKFLVRGYEHDETEMSYVAGRLLDYWSNNAQETVATGKDALGINPSDAPRVTRLRQLVFQSFALVVPAQSRDTRLKRRSTQVDLSTTSGECVDRITFFSASSWWRLGWLQVLGCSSDPHLGVL